MKFYISNSHMFINRWPIWFMACFDIYLFSILVCVLENSLRSDRQQLQDLRSSLSLERQRNNDLVNRIGHQNKENASVEVERDLLRRQSSYHEDRLQKLV